MISKNIVTVKNYKKFNSLNVCTKNKNNSNNVFDV